MICPECGKSEMWDERKSKWWGDGLGKSGKPKPIYKCKDKECEGVLWREDVDDDDDYSPPRTIAPRAATPAPPVPRQDDRLIQVAERIAIALEQISQRLSELKWIAPLSDQEERQYEAEAQQE